MSWLGLQSFLTAINDKITRKDDIYIKFAEVVNYHFKYKLFFIRVIIKYKVSNAYMDLWTLANHVLPGSLSILTSTIPVSISSASSIPVMKTRVLAQKLYFILKK